MADDAALNASVAEPTHTHAALMDKIGALLLIGGVSFVCGLLPLCYSRLLSTWRRRHTCCSDTDNGGRTELVMSGVLCIGSGVLFATVFTHMLPEIQQNFDALQQAAVLPRLNIALGELVFCLGFLLVYMIEEVVQVCMAHRHSSDNVRISEYSTFNDHLTPVSSAHEKDVCAHRLEASQPNHSAKQRTIFGNSTPTTVDDSDGVNCRRPLLHSQLQHSHCVDVASVHVLRAYLIVLAISVHALLEGLAVAFEDSAAHVWALVAAIMAHKSIINICLGEQLLATGRSVCFIVANMATLSFSSSVGVLIGVLVNQLGDDTRLVTAVLQSLAAGTILYVMVFELLAPERLKQGSGVIKFSAVLFGFVLMIFVQQFTTGESK